MNLDDFKLLDKKQEAFSYGNEEETQTGSKIYLTFKVKNKKTYKRRDLIVWLDEFGGDDWYDKDDYEISRLIKDTIDVELFYY